MGVCVSADAGAFVLRHACPHCLHLWPENTWMQLDVGLDHLLCRGHGSGDGSYCSCCWCSSKTHRINLTFSYCSLRPSGAISEHLCTPALLSHTESQQTSCGPSSPSTCSSPLCRLCWHCAATPAPLILWSPFPWGRSTATRRKTRRQTHARHWLLRNMSL